MCKCTTISVWCVRGAEKVGNESSLLNAHSTSSHRCNIYRSVSIEMENNCSYLNEMRAKTEMEANEMKPQ